MVGPFCADDQRPEDCCQLFPIGSVRDQILQESGDVQESHSMDLGHGIEEGELFSVAQCRYELLQEFDWVRQVLQPAQEEV
jgi:hypothetical protein